MKSVRDLINLVEGKKIESSVTPDMLKTKALDVAKKFAEQNSTIFGKPDMTWVNALKNEIKECKDRFDEAQAEEKAYADEEGEHYEVKPFDLKINIDNILYEFWSKIEYSLNISLDIEHEYREWREYHPKTELCDQLDIFEAQRQVCFTLRKGFYNIPTMFAVLQQLESLADDLRKYYNIDTFRPTVTSMETLIMAGIPLVLFYCKLLSDNR